MIDKHVYKRCPRGASAPLFNISPLSFVSLESRVKNFLTPDF